MDYTIIEKSEIPKAIGGCNLRLLEKLPLGKAVRISLLDKKSAWLKSQSFQGSMRRARILRLGYNFTVKTRIIPNGDNDYDLYVWKEKINEKP